MIVKSKKKLIESSLPLDAINAESLRRKQKAPKGWPTSFHKWWAQRPLAAARAVIFGQMVDDPEANPDLFPTEKARDRERRRLHGLIEELVQWDNSSNAEVLRRAREEIWQSWRRACAENADHPEAPTIFDRSKLPEFYDPFAGSGSIPMSAQWLGLKSHGSDLNPVAVVINKALIEIPARFTGNAPVNSEARDAQQLIDKSWEGGKGIAEDVRYYAGWLRSEAEKRIGSLYPKITVTKELAHGRSDLQPLIGRELTVVAYLWARTVKSPHPAFGSVDIPLVSSFLISSKAGKEAWVEPVIENGGYRFVVRRGKPADIAATKAGTKISQGAFKCVMSGTPFQYAYIDDEAMAGRMGARLMAIVAEADRGRVYLSPTPEQEQVAKSAQSSWRPETECRGTWASNAQGRRYGFSTFGDYFSERQLAALSVFSDLVIESAAIIRKHAVAAGLKDDSVPLRDGGHGAFAYAEAVKVYLACIVDRMIYYGSTLATWLPKDNALRDCMPRQAFAMTWDFAEGNPLAKSSGDVTTCAKAVSYCIEALDLDVPGQAYQCAAQLVELGNVVISTDPPYYDNISYADLSDYFYVWLRRSLKDVFPDLFSTLAVPKSEELVASAHRHGGKESAEAFFLQGMTVALRRLADKSHPAFPMTIYYAFKQTETDDEDGTASTGWETFLEAVISAGLVVSGTVPLRTEGQGRMIADGANALASSIVIVCRKRSEDASTITRQDFKRLLDDELRNALRHLQASNIAPVDLAQAAIGPGMAVFTRHAKVVDAQGKALCVRDALTLINETLDAVLAEQEGDFDADTRWALAWFEQHGFAEGEFGLATVLAQAKNTGMNALVEAGVIESKRGKVRLLKPEELPENWSPTTDNRLTNWETVHHLIRALNSGGGEQAAAQLISALGTSAEAARELAYRLYAMCERKRRSGEALAYNGLVQSWPELAQLAQENSAPTTQKQEDLFS